MRRREFVRVAAGGVAAAALASSTEGCESSAPGNAEEAPFQRWTWVHGGGDRDRVGWEDQYHRLAEAGFDGVLVGGGNPGLHAEAAHQAGLEYHRWIWTLNRNGDEWVKANHPEWFTVSRDGESTLNHPPYVEYYKWLCPTRPEVRAYLRDSMEEAALLDGVDGIHLDYVRHSDVILPRGLWAKYDLIQDQEYPEFDFCYCETCREVFSSIHGVDPLELPDPPSDDRWRAFRWDSVTGLVSSISEAVGASGKQLSAAVFPTPTIARSLVRQAWDEWPVDTVFPMLYHSFYEEGLEWIGRGVAEGLAALASRGEHPSPKRLIAGLYLPSLSGEERAMASEIAKDAGAHGVSFFEMGNLGL